MGGDLNLKKSWHPYLLKNQERVWQEEKKALEERKRLVQWQKEREEERQLLELRKIQETAGGKAVHDRVDFLYSGPAQGMDRTTEEMEAYLLGKRRIDSLLKGQDNEKLKKDAGQEGFLKPSAAAAGGVAAQRDVLAKVREDPLLAIKKREQETLAAVVRDPIRRRKLQEVMVAGGKGQGKERERDRKRHRHRGDDREERHHRHHRHRSRSRSQRRHSHRDRSRSRSPRRDRDEKREDRHSTYNHRTRSPRKSTRDSNEHSRRHRSRSPTALRGERDHDRRDHHSVSPQPARRHSPPAHRESPRYNSRAEKDRVPSTDKEAERARKLAEMQSNASSLDEERAKRLAALAEQEKAEAEADEAARRRNFNNFGGRAQFLNRAHRQAGELDLADRVGRSRQGLVQGRDED